MSQLYGIFRRTVPRSELDAWERRQRDLEEAWDLRNEALADALDTMIGKVVALRREIRIGFGELGSTKYRKGSRFRVQGRICDRFLASLERDKSLIVNIDATDVKRVREE